MAVIATGSGGSAVWAGGNATLLVAAGGIGGNAVSWTLNSNGPALDATILGDGTSTFAQGIRDWGGTIEVLLTSPAPGVTGLVNSTASPTNAYDANIRAWTLNINTPEVETTAFQGTEVNQYWRQYAPGLLSWDGAYEAMIDGTTLLTNPGIADDLSGTNVTEPAQVSLQIGEAGVADSDLSGTILTTALSASLAPSALPSANYTFQGSGALTSAQGTTARNFFATGAVSNPGATELILKPDGTRTYTGDAFWTSIGITVNPNALIRATITFRGTEILAIA